MTKKNKIETIRHSTAHLLAAAVLKLFPRAKFGIGPVIENGFYYDFELPRSLTPEDLPKIEKEMKKLIKENLPFEKKEITIEEAIKLFKKLKQPYKIELLEDLKKYGTTEEKKRKKTSAKHKNDKITIYKVGDFIDLCRGPHVHSTKEITPFKLTKIAGAYWRGKETNKMLQRIYGISFFTQKELENYLEKIKEAEKRDHRILGKELDLFSFDEEVGAGLVLWHPKGALIRKIIEQFWIEEHLKNGYQLVKTPHIGNIQLWKTSGHWNFYRENIYSPIDIEGEKYLLKPMNCPFHIKIYKSKIRSYRDLPLRWAELGTVYRYEKSGVLHGLTRVRGFTQDDAHIFCTPEQLEKELIKIIEFVIYMLKIFGFNDFDAYLSTRPEKYVGTLNAWEKATNALRKSLEKVKLKYKIDSGAGVFYGPKIDIKIKDSLGRAWQCSTIQVDFNLPERFKMKYTDSKGKEKRPIMIHRALLGSIERFFGVLLEHYGGAFPLWLSPTQVYITPVGKAYQKIAEKIAKELEENNIRVWLDELNETIGYKIRKAEKEKIPYMLVIGEKEAKSNYLNVRQRGEKKIIKMGRKKFIEKIKKEIAEKK